MAPVANKTLFTSAVPALAMGRDRGQTSGSIAGAELAPSADLTLA